MNASVYLRPELEDVADFDATCCNKRARAVGRRVSVADLGRFDGAVGGEVTAHDQANDMLVGCIRAGDPRRAVHYPWIEKIANLLACNAFRTDISLHQERVLGEIRVVEQRVLGGVQRSAESLLVDLAVARHPDGQQFPFTAGLTDLEQNVLQRVGGRDLPAEADSVGPLHQRRDGRRVRGVVHLGLRQTLDRHRFRHRGDDRLDVGGIPGLQAPHEGVLADLALGEELLRRAAAHRPGHRRDDDVADAQRVEDALVGVAMAVVDRLEPVVVDVEGVGVLHDELAPAQDARPRPRLVAVLRLDLVQQQREVLVAAVLPLHRQREELFVGGPEEIVVVAAVLQPEHAVAVLRPPVRRLVRGTRQQRGEQDLLPPNRIHLVAHDALDLAQHPQAQRQPAVEPWSDRADVAGPDQQFVAGDLGIGRVVAQRAQEQLGHAGDHSRQPY